MKQCTKCKEIKPVSAFSKNRERSDGYSSQCKVCMSAYLKNYRELHPEARKESYIKNKERELAVGKIYCLKNKDAISRCSKEWHSANAEHVKNNEKIYRSQHRDVTKINQKRRRSTQRGKLNCNIGNGICGSIMKGSKRNRHWESLVNFTIDQLKKHLEKRFTPEMNWGNYGSYWHIDHKIPVAAFNFEKPDDIDFRLCWSLKNLQPLEARENMRKNDSLDRPYQPSLAMGG